MKSFIVSAFLVCFAPMLSASPSEAESQISELFSRMTQAWEDGNGAAWGESFIPDADFTVWFGMELEGRKAIAGGHQFIFDNFYGGTSYQLVVRKVRFLTSEIVIVHLTGSVVRPGEPLPQEPDTVPMAVVQSTDSGWKVVAFHNTAFAVSRYGRNGDIRAFKGRRESDIDQ